MSTQINRFWGEEKDAIASKQLGLSDNHTIFMMANRGDFIPDEVYENIHERFDGEFCQADEVTSLIQEQIKEILLPGHLHLVGMRTLDNSGPKIYGIVDFEENKPILEVVGYQRLSPSDGWTSVFKDDIEHYRAKGQEIREVYAIVKTEVNEELVV